jgi:hypothetical protein
MKRLSRRDPTQSDAFAFRIGSAVAMSVFLLLFMGNFGHNLFRHNWLWFGGFLIISGHVAKHGAMATSKYWSPVAGRVMSWRARVGHA